jgi:hypothetical protein
MNILNNFNIKTSNLVKKHDKDHAILKKPI